MTISVHLDFPPAKDCKHPEWTYGELCVKCGECGRFDKGGDKNPVRSSIHIITQGHNGIPPLWDKPREYLVFHKGKWAKCRSQSRKWEDGTLEEMLPSYWHKRELDYVRWWIEGINY